MTKVSINLDFSLTDNTYQHVLNICKTDYDSREITATFRDENGPYSLNGITKIILRAKKPDGSYLYTSCRKAGDTAEYTLGRVILAVAGEVQCQFVLIGGNGEEISSPKFKINVSSPVVADTELTGLNDYSALTEYASDAEEYASRAEAAAVLSETYADEAAAVEDEIASLSSKLTRAETAITAAEEALESASEFEQELSESAASASASATSASASAASASASAASASESATSASASAATATAKANSASSSASTATSAKNEANRSATKAEECCEEAELMCQEVENYAIEIYDIVAASLAGYLRNGPQSMTELQKAQIRKNIGLPGKFECLECIEVAEDTQSVVRNTYQSGESYNLSNVIITLSMSSPHKINFQGLTRGNGLIWFISSDVAHTHYVLRSIMTSEYRNTYMSMHDGSLTNGGETKMYGALITHPIYGISVNSSTDDFIPAGSVIEIYGVKN